MKNEKCEQSEPVIHKVCDGENEKLKNEIKSQILKKRLKEVFSKNPKKIAKILSFLIKRQKNV